MELKSGMKVLFDGDSITDAGRDRADRYGWAGYVALCGKASAPHGVEVFNRGISGDRTINLLARIEPDLAEVRPDALVILIGINDTWRRYDSNDTTSVRSFEKNYRMILESAQKYVSQILLMEPYLIPTDPQKACFREDLDPKIQVVRKLAREFRTEFLPLDGLFAEASVKDGPEAYSDDGVHPNRGGQEFIAREWLKRVRFL